MEFGTGSSVLADTQRGVEADSEKYAGKGDVLSDIWF